MFRLEVSKVAVVLFISCMGFITLACRLTLPRPFGNSGPQSTALASWTSACTHSVALIASEFGQARRVRSTPTMSRYDPEGFDPEADTVGPGIYSGRVLRDPSGAVVIGTQYENHNTVPGPVYAGGGYTEMARAIQSGPEAVRRLLLLDPALAHEVATGGATPLHTCGMSRKGQMCTEALIEAGADPEAVDTYGYTPLHRMASNNLALGAEALLRAGVDVNRKTGAPYAGDTALKIARQSRAHDVISVLERYGAKM